MSNHEDKDLQREDSRLMDETEKKDIHFSHSLREEQTEEENIKKRKRTIFSRWKRIHK